MMKRAAAAQGLPLWPGAIVSGLSLAFFDLLLAILWGRYPFEGFDFAKYSAPALSTVVLELATTSVCFFLFFATTARLHLSPAKAGATGRPAILVFYLCFSFLAVLTDATNEALLFLAGGHCWLLILWPLVARQASISWTTVLFAAPWLSLTSVLLVLGTPFGRAVAVLVLFYAALLMALGVISLLRSATKVEFSGWQLLPPGLLGALALVGYWRVAKHPGLLALGALALCSCAACWWLLGSKRVLGPRFLNWTNAGIALVLVISGLGVALWPAASAPNASARGGERRQTILITVDSLRADAIETSVPQATRTPHIARFAQCSTDYRSAIAPSSWTLPAIASLHTGLGPDVHQLTSEHSSLDSAFQTLAEHYQREGIRTAAIVNSPYLAEHSNLHQGFDEYHPLMPAEFWLPSGTTMGKALVQALGGAAAWLPGMRQHSRVSSAELTDFAIEWLRRHGDQSFFLWIHYLDPHTPYAPPEEFRPNGAPPEGLGYHVGNVASLRAGLPPLDAHQRTWVKDLYLAEVSYVDHCLGRLFDSLRELKIFDNAQIALTSDHGEEFWEHGGFYHGHSMYGEVVNVPLLLKSPGACTRKRVTEPTSIQEVMPLLLANDELMQNDGVGADSVDAPSEASRTSVFSVGRLFGDELEMVIFDSKKLIRSRTDGRVKLYDLRSDPRELYPLRDEALLAVGKGELETNSRNAKLRHREHPADRETAARPSAEAVEHLRSLGYIE
jgi:arylsulfatase A-like enzyme